MFEFLIHGENDAIDLIKKDHENVKNLFDKFEQAESVREKRKITADTIMELKLHAAIEEEIFYAAVRNQIGKKVMNEADEEHHVVKILVAELEEMDGTEDHYDAKYKVLSENVRHHIKEEENDMLPNARSLDIDYNALGEQILKRKEQLKKNGFARFAEEKMVSKAKGKGDSPAMAARTMKKSKRTKSGKVIKLSKLAKSMGKKSTRSAAASLKKGFSKGKKPVAAAKRGTVHARKRVGRK